MTGTLERLQDKNSALAKLIEELTDAQGDELAQLLEDIADEAANLKSIADNAAEYVHSLQPGHRIII